MVEKNNNRVSKLRKVMVAAEILPAAVIATGVRTAVYFQERVRWGDPGDYLVNHGMEQGLRRDVKKVWTDVVERIRD